MSAVAVKPLTKNKTETNRWIVLVLVCLAQFMVVLDATIVNVALPSIQSDLHFSAENLQWVINGYTLLFGGFLLLGGRAADLFGRKRLFIIGISVFTAASLLDGLATSQGMLIAFRALQGLGAALVSPAALSIITTTFDEGAERTKALAVWGAIAASGSAFGLLLGGALTDALSWQWIFFVNVPIGIAALLFSLRLIPESKAEDAGGGFDLAGAVTSTAGLVALVYAIVKGQSDGWGSSTTLGFIAAAVVLLVSFVIIERRSAAPLVRLSIFKIRSLSVANGSMLVVMGGMFSMFFFATIYVQEVLGYSPMKAGLAFLPVTVGIIGGSGLAQQFIRRIGVKPVILTGMVLAAVGLALLTRTTAGGDYVTELLPSLLAIAFGMGLTFVPLTLIATTNVDRKDAGLASGLFNTSQQVGGALGLAILSTLAASKTSSVLGDISGVATPADHASALVAGYHVAYWAGAALILAGAVLMATLIRSKDLEHIDEADMAAAMAAG
jgi:EmrB/QacA subfamily drug resistance transporter